MKTTVENKYWSRRKAAKYLGISESTLDRRTREGQIAVYRVGTRIVRFTKEDLDAHMEREAEKK